MTAPILTFFGEYRFLSNFWSAPFVWEGIYWRSTEQAYQAAKAPRELWPLFAEMSAVDSKRAGRGTFSIKNDDDTTTDHSFTLREDWEEVKVGLMYEIVKCKFTQNSDLREKLLATGSAHLEEGNTWGDRIWGVDPPGSGKGKNYLGQILMRIRLELQMGWED